MCLICAVMLTFAGCSCSGENGEKESESLCTQEKKEKVVECIEEFKIPSGYSILMIEEDAKENIYMCGVNRTNYDGKYHFFMLPKEDKTYGDIVEIKVPEEYYFTNIFYNGSDDSFVLNGYMSKDVSNFMSGGEVYYKAYKANVENNSFTNVEEMDDINIALINSVSDVSGDGTIYFMAVDKEGNPKPHIAFVDGSSYLCETLETDEKTEKIIIDSTALIDIDGTDKILLISGSEDGIILKISLVSKNKLADSSVYEKMYLPAELENKNIVNISVPFSGKNVFFHVTTNWDSIDKIYKMSVEDFLLNEHEEVEYTECSYDEYDVKEHELILRDKENVGEKQGVYYEIFVRSFADSDGDGIGDFNGITEKLDYLKGLGIDGIWLMPINSSPSYHGYDVTDYYSLNEDYGTEEDFQKLLNEAHKRDIKIIMDFVINHTSSEHPWFIEACKSEDNEYRNYYRWVKSNDSVDFDISQKSDWGSTVWHKNGSDYYYGIFSGNMPDLNYNNDKVREEIKNAAKKWLEMGVDGFRLDAAIHIYGVGEFNQIDSNEQYNIQWWNEFARACEEVNPDVYLVGEAWENSNMFEEYTQPFDTKFNFTFQQDMIEAIINEESVSETFECSLEESLKMILSDYEDVSGDDYIDGIFGNNHDQDRIMSQVESIDKAKLVANIYLTLPGNPFIYYGEELGMKGEEDDLNKREPFIWTEDGSGTDTTWVENNYIGEIDSFETQKNDNDSMYNHYKKMISLRKNHEALVSGKYDVYELPHNDSNKVMSYIRYTDIEKLLVIHNFSSERIILNGENLSEMSIIYGDLGQDNGIAAYGSVILKIN